MCVLKRQKRQSFVLWGWGHATEVARARAGARGRRARTRIRTGPAGLSMYNNRINEVGGGVVLKNGECVPWCTSFQKYMTTLATDSDSRYAARESCYAIGM